MKRLSLPILAVACGVLVAWLPSLLPAGPSTSLDAASHFQSGQLAAGLAVTLLGGLLTALTPCVYPLIPITMGVFGARRESGRGKSIALISSYVLGMGLVFSVLGVLAALSGQAFGSVLGHPAVALGLAAFLLVLAASLFGAFELTLPASVAQRLSTVGGGGLVGALLMGSVSGFLAAPCTGPVLTGLLAFVAKSQDPRLGGLLLFVYAMGIGLPFFVLGLFTIRLPKSGAWMEWVKGILAIALVALAAIYVKDAFPSLRAAAAGFSNGLGAVRGALLAGLLTTVGILLGALHLSFKEGPGAFVRRAAAVGLVVVALVLRAGAMGAAPPLLKWDLIAPSASSSLADVEPLLARAAREGRPVLLDFSAEWCAACKELDRIVYVDPAVVAASDRFMKIKIDGTNDVDGLDALYERFGVVGLPTVAFLAPSGALLGEPKLTGFVESQPFVELLRKVP